MFVYLWLLLRVCVCGGGGLKAVSTAAANDAVSTISCSAIFLFFTIVISIIGGVGAIVNMSYDQRKVRAGQQAVL